MEGKYQNEISELPLLDKNRYETLFKLYNADDTPNNFYYYNITRGVKIDTSNLDPAYFDTFTINRDISWPTLSHQLYGSIYLWWLIKIINPSAGLFRVTSGTELTVIKPEFIDQILDSIQDQIKV